MDDFVALYGYEGVAARIPAYTPECLEEEFYELRPPLHFVPLVVTLGRRSSGRVAL